MSFTSKVLPIALKVLSCQKGLRNPFSIRGYAMLKRGIVAVLSELTFLFSMAPEMAHSAFDGQWNSLRQITNRANYIFVRQGPDCIGGTIKQVNESNILITRKDGSEVVIRKTDLLRVTLGAWDPGVILTGRSSWLDVRNLVGRHFRPEVAVAMKSGQKHKGDLLSASEESVALRTAGATLNISRVDVSTISYIRSKPLSSSAAYADEELAWMKIFDPELWPHLLHLQSPLSILLYDASAPQDDSRIVCKQDPWTGRQQGPDVTRGPY